MRARVSFAETAFSNHGVLFKPNHKVLDPLGINVTESLVPLRNGEIVLPVENHQGNTIHLDGGVELGYIRSTLVQERSDQPVVEPVEMTSCNALVHVEKTPTGQVEKLLQAPSGEAVY